MDLSLEVMHAGDVQAALKRLTYKERLDGQNKYQCDECKAKVPADKQFTVHRAPNVLVLHLKVHALQSLLLNLTLLVALCCLFLAARCHALESLKLCGGVSCPARANVFERTFSITCKALGPSAFKFTRRKQRCCDVGAFNRWPCVSTTLGCRVLAAIDVHD